MTVAVERSNVVHLREVKLELHPPPDYVSDLIRETGDFHEAAILDAIVSRIRPGLIVDAGAMIGNHAAYFATFVRGATVEAFEPVPANFRLLWDLALRIPSINPRRMALSDHFGNVRLLTEPGNLGHSQISPDGEIGALATPLDSYRFADVSLLKIDVEGHEREVLAGARQTIERWHPLVLIEDWPGEGYGELLSGYRLAAEWQEAHQTYLYEWAA